MENNGNFFNLTEEEIRGAIIRIFEEFARTDVEVIRNQYLAHVKYWEEVLREIKRKTSFLFCKKIQSIELFGSNCYDECVN